MVIGVNIVIFVALLIALKTGASLGGSAGVVANNNASPSFVKSNKAGVG